MLAVKPSCTCEAVALNDSVIDGSVDMYMSVTNGANTVSAASMTRRKIVGRSEALSINAVLMIGRDNARWGNG